MTTGMKLAAGVRRQATIFVSLMALTGCASTPLGQAIRNVMDRGSDAPVAAAAQDASVADENGIIAYDNFRVMVAQDGDTIAGMAARVGLTDLVLARYNGLPTDYLLRQGDRLALPDEAQVAAVEQGWTPEVVTGVLDELPDAPGAAAPVQQPPGNLPLRHRVEPGETLFGIAKLYGVSVTSLASWNGIGGDLVVNVGRSLIIPTQAPVQVAAAPAPEPQPAPAPAATLPAGQSEPGEGTAVVAPPSATQPLPENPPVVAPPEGPDLGATVTPQVAGEKMQTPVEGEIIRPFSAAPGRNKNDGIDYRTAPGAVVRAAASGEVALVSLSEGLGWIVLVRHRDNIITVYGLLSENVQVQKGEQVRKGQVIGTVEDANPPTFHFEVRRGTQAIDPTPFL